MIAASRQLGLMGGCGLLALVVGCATSQTANVREIRPQPIAARPNSAATIAQQPREQIQVAKTDSTVRPSVIEPASFTTEVIVPPKPAEPDQSSPTTSQMASPTGYAIDLASALQLACGQNPNVAFARERINEAYAQHARAEALWLPSIRAGAN